MKESQRAYASLQMPLSSLLELRERDIVKWVVRYL